MIPLAAVARIALPLAIEIGPHIVNHFHQRRERPDLKGLGKRDHAQSNPKPLRPNHRVALVSALPLAALSAGKALEHPRAFNIVWHKGTWPAVRWIDAVRIAHHAAKPRRGYRF